MASPLPKLILYRIDGACSLAAHMALHELQIPFTTARMVINPTTQKAEAADGTLTYDEYVREIHPNGQVPALEVYPPESETPPENEKLPKPVAITENPAILMYIADLATSVNPSSPKLAGSTLLERAQVTSWLTFLSGSVHGQAYGALYRPRRYIDGERFPQAENAVREAGRRSLDLFYGQIEERLVEGGWAVGEAMTVADLNLYVFYRWGIDLGIKMKEVYPRWSDLARRLEARPNVKTAVWIEGLGSVF
ncbi:glutathione S-transferase [Podospora aff. communis PSN243]|uniref:Glutathione S-transferase n=1 Tax=Podospora aff. communis PSN243 TaxID=3040156 RepID=A0AAV9GIH9_9PEZI|nr:glutathione S-transferase [Podospora aff. communis PSN243]